MATIERDGYGFYVMCKGEKMYFPDSARRAYDYGIFQEINKEDCGSKYRAEGIISTWEVGPYETWSGLKFEARVWVKIEKIWGVFVKLLNGKKRNLNYTFVGNEMEIASVVVKSIGSYDKVEIGTPVKFSMVYLYGGRQRYAINVRRK